MARVYPGADGNLSLAEGDYGADGCGLWSVRPPGQHAGTLPNHVVDEHKDGTISVSPSIVLHNADGSVCWHGYLKLGNWHEV